MNGKVVELIVKLTNVQEVKRDLNSLEQLRERLNNREISLKLNTNELRREKLSLERELDRLTNLKRDITFGQSGLKDTKAIIDRLSDALKRVQIEAERVRLDGGNDAALRRVANSLKEQIQHWREVDHAVKNAEQGVRGYDQQIAATKASIQDVNRQLNESANTSRELSMAQKAVNDEIKARKNEEREAAKETAESAKQAKAVAAAYREVRSSMLQSADNIKQLRAEQLKKDFEEAWTALQKLNQEYDAFQRKQVEAAAKPGQIIQQIGAGITGIGNALKRVSGIFTDTNITGALKRLATVSAATMFTQNWKDAFTRYDILSTYSDYLDMVGVSAEQAGESLAKLNAGIQGIPIGLSDVAYQARMYQMYVDDLERATNLAIGLERALVAGGANEQMRNTARYEIDRLLSAGELSTTRQYRALMQGLGVSSRYLREEMGYGDLTNAQFIKQLFEKEISGDELIKGIEKLASSDKLNHAIEVYRTTIESGLSNIKFAITRGKANILEALNSSLESGTGKDISGWLYAIRDAINEVYASATNWVKMNPEQISSFMNTLVRIFDRLRDIDFARIIEGVLNGFERLVDVLVGMSEKIPDGLFEDFFVFSTVYAGPIGTGLQIIGSALQKFGAALSTVMVALTAYNVHAVFVGAQTLTLGAALAKLAPAIPVLMGLAAAILAVKNAMDGTDIAVAKFGFKLRDLEQHANRVKTAVETATNYKPTDLGEAAQALDRAKELISNIRFGNDVAASVRELTELFPELDIAVDSTTGKISEASKEALKGADAFVEYQTALKKLDTVKTDTTDIQTNIRLVNEQIEDTLENLDKLRKKRDEEKARATGSYEFSSYELIGLEKQIQKEEGYLQNLLSAREKLGRDAQTVGQRKNDAERVILEMAAKIPGFVGQSAEDALAAIDEANTKLSKLQEENKKFQENLRKALDDMFSGFGAYEAPDAVDFADLEKNLNDQVAAFEKFLDDISEIRKYLITNPNAGLASYVDSLYQQGDSASIAAIAQKLAEKDYETLQELGDKYGEFMAEKELETQRSAIIAALAKYGPEEVIKQYTSGQLSYGGDLEKVILEYYENLDKKLTNKKLVQDLLKGGKTEVGTDPSALLHPEKKFEFNLSDYLYMGNPTETGEKIAENSSEAIEEAKRQLEAKLKESGSLISSITGISDEDFEKQKAEYAQKAKELVEAIVGGMAEATAQISSDEEGLAGGIQKADEAFKIILDEAFPPFVDAVTELASAVENFATNGFGILKTTADEATEAIDKLREAIENLASIMSQKLSVLAEFTRYLEAVKLMAQNAEDAVNDLKDAIDALQDKTITISVNIEGAEGLGDLGGGGGDGGGGGSTPHTGGLIGADGGVRYYAKGGLLSRLFKPVGTDTIPAMLTPGEYVMRRGAVEQLGVPFLQRLNRMDIAGALDNLMHRFYRPSQAAYNVVNSSDNRAWNVTVNNYQSTEDFTYRVAAHFAHALG